MKVNITSTFCERILSIDNFFSCTECGDRYENLPCTGGLDITYPNEDTVKEFTHNDILKIKAFLECPLDVLTESIFSDSCGKDKDRALYFINKYLESKKSLRGGHVFILARDLEMTSKSYTPDPLFREWVLIHLYKWDAEHPDTNSTLAEMNAAFLAFKRTRLGV